MWNYMLCLHSLKTQRKNVKLREWLLLKGKRQRKTGNKMA